MCLSVCHTKQPIRLILSALNCPMPPRSPPWAARPGGRPPHANGRRYTPTLRRTSAGCLPSGSRWQPPVPAQIPWGRARPRSRAAPSAGPHRGFPTRAAPPRAEPRTPARAEVGTASRACDTSPPRTRRAARAGPESLRYRTAASCGGPEAEAWVGIELPPRPSLPSQAEGREESTLRRLVVMSRKKMGLLLFIISHLTRGLGVPAPKPPLGRSQPYPTGPKTDPGSNFR